MRELRVEELKRYLAQVFKGRVIDVSVGELGTGVQGDLKGFGYGKPFAVKVNVDGSPREVVLGTMRGDSFGHEFPYDRAHSLLMAYQTFNRLPRHVKALDVGAFMEDGSLRSLGGFEEFFLLTEKADGQEYYRDLERIKEARTITSMDEERCLALSKYLVEVHGVKRGEPGLYRRRVRELIGHGECVMGLIDNYPDDFNLLDVEGWKALEHMWVEWRWRLRGKAHRLSRVHGDFHPWNILFRDGADFTALDRSRGEWGEPADDVAAMTINYLFYSLQAYGEIKDPFKRLFELFWENYLDKTGDEEILTVIQPFYAWRGLVIASPIWYPNLTVEIRRKIFSLIRNMLEVEIFDIKIIDSYLKV